MHKVLVVDDECAVTRALFNELHARGYDVLTANDAETASLIALRERPDLILLDLDMPHYTGLELHQALQFSERGQRIPVAFLVSDSHPSYREMALKQGAKAVVQKPYDLHELLKTMERIIGSSQVAETTDSSPSRHAITAAPAFSTRQ